jgi:hypothetical protein
MGVDVVLGALETSMRMAPIRLARAARYTVNRPAASSAATTPRLLPKKTDKLSPGDMRVAAVRNQYARLLVL